MPFNLDAKSLAIGILLGWLVLPRVATAVGAHGKAAAPQGA